MAMISRRRLLQAAPLLGAALAQAQTQPLLKESDDEAKATDYHADASKVDKAKSPKYQAGRTCANCGLYTPDGDKPSGGCALFYGKDVLAKAWCNAWVKPG
ncbi:high-potential iron-sulfur protein [Roseateles sp. BYS96W]|uniref:High-potential iron-sulfur protein n=1 Tax=Pelomonas nitida TaxID=3299027 RepID=A0ABW7G7X5_9BURK